MGYYGIIELYINRTVFTSVSIFRILRIIMSGSKRAVRKSPDNGPPNNGVEELQIMQNRKVPIMGRRIMA